MSTHSTPPADSYSPELAEALTLRSEEDLFPDAEENERTVTSGFDQDQLDDGDPCYSTRERT